MISLLLNEGTSLQAKWYERNCVHKNEGNNHHKIEAYFLVKKVAFHELIPRLRDIALWAANRLPLLSLLISE